MLWKVVKAKDWKRMHERISGMDSLIEEVKEVISAVERESSDICLSQSLIHSSLGGSIQSLLEYLRQVKKEESERSWVEGGLAFFMEILRNSKGLELKELLNQVLSETVRYTGSNQGSLFILEGDAGPEGYLELVACYAYEKRKYIDKRQSVRQGLAGQAVLDKDIIYLKDIPRDYVRITSGLGESTPRNVLISPLIANDVPVGVVELASFSDYGGVKVEFVKKISESVASVIKTGRERERLEQVLYASREQAEKLRMQEEEMRQQLEEMECLQENLTRNEVELKRRLYELEQALRAEKEGEIAKIREEEKRLLESKLETQKQSYELIIDRLKQRLQVASDILITK